jgi:hypothetical protein
MININKIYILLFIWVFALAAPTVISILDNDFKIVVKNFSEEEHQQHQGEKVKEIEKYVAPNFYALSYRIKQKNLAYINSSFLYNSQYFAKIIIPPPDLTA